LNDYYRYYMPLKKRSTTVGGMPAWVFGCLYDHESDFREGWHEESVYISTGNGWMVRMNAKTVRILFENGRSLWEKMYSSFRSDLSQDYRTPFGSFRTVDYMKDFSRVRYYINGGNYSIKFFYKNSGRYGKGKGDALLGLLMKFYGVSYAVRDRKLIIGGRKSTYSLLESSGEKMARIEINEGLDPGLVVEVMASDKNFDKYRAEMEHVLRTLRFD